MLPARDVALIADVLDTNILVHAVRGSITWQRIKALRDPLMAELCPIYSVVTEAEIRTLARVLEWGLPKVEQMNFLLQYFRRTEVSTPQVIEAYSLIDAYSRKQGIKMGKNDLWIAATANVNGGLLVTTDKDFEHLHGTFVNRFLIEAEK